MSRTIARSFLACAALLACAKAGDKADTAAVADSAAAATPAAPAPAPAPALNLADVAGKWTIKATNEAGDSTLVTYDLDAKADPNGWTITLPGRGPVALHVVPPAGDSVVVHAGPYESVLRKGVQVTTEGVLRLQGGKLVGTSTAHYTTTGPDSVRRLRLEGTRKP